MEERINKGQSLIAFIDDYVAVDLETTGLDPRFDAIIEIAAVKVAGGKPVDSFATLVKPPFEVDEFITELTGITNDMLAHAPAIEAVLPSFLEFVGDGVVVGHNANFDINFLYDEAQRRGWCFQNNFVDTMRLSRRLFKDFESHKLATLVKNFGISVHPEHRALADAEAALGCYEYMKQYAAENSIAAESLLPARTPSVRAADIAATVTEFDESHPLFGKVCVFTGALSILRKDAMQLVANVGGINADSISKHTNFLIIGNNDYNPLIKGGKSGKQRKAEALILAGQDITVLSEQAFLDLLKDSQVKADIPIPENQMPAAHYAYACAVSAALSAAGVDKEYLRFGVDGERLEALCYFSFARIMIRKKSTYLIGGVWGCEVFKAHYPEAEITQLAHEYRITLNSPDDVNTYAAYFAAAYASAIESINTQASYHPDIVAKRLKKYLNSKEFYKV